jgi:hypothetical protein
MNAGNETNLIFYCLISENIMKRFTIILCILILIISEQDILSQKQKYKSYEENKIQELEKRVFELEQKFDLLYKYVNNFKNVSTVKFIIKFYSERQFKRGEITNENDLLQEQFRFRENYETKLLYIKNKFSLNILKINDCYVFNPNDVNTGKGELPLFMQQYLSLFLKDKNPQNEITKICLEGDLGFFDNKFEALEFIDRHLPEDLNYYVEEIR